MWRSGQDQDRTSVTCVACGESLRRVDAREYDKHGDRWNRVGKDFEYLCKPCYRDLCHQPRDDLEGLLVDIDAGDLERREFFRQFAAAVEDGNEAVEE